MEFLTIVIHPVAAGVFVLVDLSFFDSVVQGGSANLQHVQDFSGGHPFILGTNRGGAEFLADDASQLIGGKRYYCSFHGVQI